MMSLLNYAHVLKWSFIYFIYSYTHSFERRLKFIKFVEEIKLMLYESYNHSV